MRSLLLLLPLLPLLLAAPAAAQTDPVGRPVRIDVITDMNGGLAAQAGSGAVLAVQMAVEDCLLAECKGMTVDVISADHQNKADVAVAIVRDWWDNKGVTAVADIVQATVQIAVQHEAAAPNKVALFSGGTARLTSEDCAPATSVMWMWDTYGQAVGIVKPLAKPGAEVVLHHRRLRVRQVATGGCHRPAGEGRRQRGRLRQPSLQLLRRLLAFPPARPGVRSRRRRTRQHRGRPHHLRQARHRSSASAVARSSSSPSC